MFRWTITGIAILCTLLGWVGGDYYGTSHARDLSGFIGSLIGAGVAGLIAPWLVVFQARHQRRLGRAIIKDLFDVANFSIANFEAAREGRPPVTITSNSPAGEIDAAIKSLRAIESVCQDLQATVPGAAALRMVLEAERPRLTTLENLAGAVTKYEKESNLLDSLAGRKMIFAPQIVEAVQELKDNLAKAERHLTSGIAERHITL